MMPAKDMLTSSLSSQQACSQHVLHRPVRDRNGLEKVPSTRMTGLSSVWQYLPVSALIYYIIGVFLIGKLLLDACFAKKATVGRIVSMPSATFAPFSSPPSTDTM